MNFMNPLATSVASAGLVSKTQSEDRDRQVKREEALRRNTALRGDKLEHEVETADSVILREEGDKGRDEQRKKRRNARKAEVADADDGPGGLDLRA
jgi:hypothetical protein